MNTVDSRRALNNSGNNNKQGQQNSRYGGDWSTPDKPVLQKMDLNISYSSNSRGGSTIIGTKESRSISPHQKMPSTSYQNNSPLSRNSSFKKISIQQTPHYDERSSESSGYYIGTSGNFSNTSQDTMLSTTEASFAQFLNQAANRKFKGTDVSNTTTGGKNQNHRQTHSIHQNSQNNHKSSNSYSSKRQNCQIPDKAQNSQHLQNNQIYPNTQHHQRNNPNDYHFQQHQLHLQQLQQNQQNQHLQYHFINHLAQPNYQQIPQSFLQQDKMVIEPQQMQYFTKMAQNQSNGFMPPNHFSQESQNQQIEMSRDSNMSDENDEHQRQNCHVPENKYNFNMHSPHHQIQFQDSPVQEGFYLPYQVQGAAVRQNSPMNASSFYQNHQNGNIHIPNQKMNNFSEYSTPQSSQYSQKQAFSNREAPQYFQPFPSPCSQHLYPYTPYYPLQQPQYVQQQPQLLPQGYISSPHQQSLSPKTIARSAYSQQQNMPKSPLSCEDRKNISFPYETFGENNNCFQQQMYLPQNNPYNQCGTGSSVIQQSNNGSINQSNTLQNSEFINNIPKPIMESTKSTLQMQSTLGSYHQNKSGFLNTQSSFANGSINKQYPGLFNKCPQLQKIIDDLKENIVKDLENLSNKLQKESETLLHSQNSQNSGYSNQKQQPQPQIEKGGYELGEYSLGDDKKVRFSFSGREVIAQISSTNQRLKKSNFDNKENILSTFTTPIQSEQVLSPHQQQIIAASLAENLPFHRLNPLSSFHQNNADNQAIYLPTFSSPQRGNQEIENIVYIPRGNAAVEVKGDYENSQKEGNQDSQLFNQFFKSESSQHLVQLDEDKKNQFCERSVQNGTPEKKKRETKDENKSQNTEESETVIGKQTPKFESSKTKNCHKNAIELNNSRNISPLSPEKEKDKTCSREYGDEFQSLAQNIIKGVASCKNENLFSENDDVVLRTDNTDQLSEGSPKGNKISDMKNLKALNNPADNLIMPVALDNIYENEEENIDSTPKTVASKISPDRIQNVIKNHSIHASPASHFQTKIDEDLAVSAAPVEQMPLYRGSTKSNSSQSSRYQEFSSASSKKTTSKQENTSSNNNSSQGIHNLNINCEANYSSNSSNTPGSSRYATTSKVPSQQSLKSSYYSHNNSVNSNAGDFASKYRTERDNVPSIETNNLPFKTAPSSTLTSPHTTQVRFSTYLREHKEEKKEEKISDQSAQLLKKMVECKNDKNDSHKNQKIGEQNNGTMTRNYSFIPTQIESSSSKQLLFKNKSNLALFSEYMNEAKNNNQKEQNQENNHKANEQNKEKIEYPSLLQRGQAVDTLVSKENPLDSIRENNIHLQESQEVTNQFQGFQNPPSVHQSACKQDGGNSQQDERKQDFMKFQNSSRPSFYESTQKLIENSVIISRKKSENIENNENDNLNIDAKHQNKNKEDTRDQPNQIENSQTIQEQSTPEKIKNVDEDITYALRIENSSGLHKPSSLPPKAPRSTNDSSASKIFNSNSKEKKKGKVSIMLNDSFENSDLNSIIKKSPFDFSQTQDLCRNLKSELDQTDAFSFFNENKEVKQPQPKEKEDENKEKDEVNNGFKESSIENSSSNLRINYMDKTSHAQEQRSIPSLQEIPESCTDPSFSKSQSHPNLLVSTSSNAESDTPHCEITISIVSRKNSSINQSKTILKKSLINSPTSLSKANIGASVKKSQRRISFKDKIEEVNYFEPEDKSSTSRSPMGVLSRQIPRTKPRLDFKKEPYFNPIKKFPGIQNNPTFLKQYNTNGFDSLNISLLDDKSPIKCNDTSLMSENTPKILEAAPSNNIFERRNSKSDKQESITPTKKTPFKPMSFTPTGNSSKNNKPTKLSFLEYSKITKQQQE